MRTAILAVTLATMTIFISVAWGYSRGADRAQARSDRSTHAVGALERSLATCDAELSEQARDEALQEVVAQLYRAELEIGDGAIDAADKRLHDARKRLRTAAVEAPPSERDQIDAVAQRIEAVRANLATPPSRRQLRDIANQMESELLG